MGKINQKLVIIPSKNYFLPLFKASILDSLNDRTFDYFWNHFQLFKLFDKPFFIFHLFSLIVLIELEIIMLDFLDLYLCIKGQCWFQKLIEIHITLKQLLIDDQLDLGLSFRVKFNFFKPSLERLRGLLFFWNIQS